MFDVFYKRVRKLDWIQQVEAIELNMEDFKSKKACELQ